jgi:protocatechuate 3,4-dioxygenase beta subunit
VNRAPRPSAFALAASLAAATMAQVQRVPLTGTVVDEQGRPVVDAVVEVYRAEGRGFVCLDLALRNSWPLLQQVPVDKRGRFGLQVPPGLVLRVQVQHPGHARWRRDEITPGDELPIVLGPRCTFRGQLVLGAAGTPGRLRAWDAQHTELFDARTDGEGRFAFEDLPAGNFTCEVLPDAAKAPQWFHGELTAGQPLEQRFELQPGVVLQGRITDAVTGKPIAGARIGENWTLDKAVASGADGRYVLRGYGQEGAPDVECIARGYERACTGKPEKLADPTTMDFALRPGFAVTGVIVDPQGKPRGGVYAAVIGIESVPGAVAMPLQRLMWLPVRTDGQGRFAIDGVHRGIDATLMLRCEGCATVIHALPAAKDKATVDAGTLRLRTAEVVRGTVVDGAGKPLADVEVQLLGSNDDRALLAPVGGGTTRVDYYVAGRKARTDSHGAFAFGDVPPGHYTATFEATAKQPSSFRVDVEVVAGKPTAPVVLAR